MSDTHDAACLARFCRLAQDGAHPAASTGETIANRLAKAVHAIGDDMALLDGDALHGFHLLCQLASGPWPTDESKSRIFETLRRAAN